MNQLRRALESLVRQARAGGRPNRSSVRVTNDRNVVTTINTEKTGDSSSASSAQDIRIVQDSSGMSKKEHEEKHHGSEEA